MLPHGKLSQKDSGSCASSCFIKLHYASCIFLKIFVNCHILWHLVWLNPNQESQQPSLYARLCVTMFQEDGVVPGGFVGSLLAREEAEERRLQVLQDSAENIWTMNIYHDWDRFVLQFGYSSKHQFSLQFWYRSWKMCSTSWICPVDAWRMCQEDCVDWLRQHGAKDVGLVGHSRGGVTISQLEGDFCRVTWIRKAMVLAEWTIFRPWDARWTSLDFNHLQSILKIHSEKERKDPCWSFVVLKTRFVPGLPCRWSMLHGCTRT